MPYQFEVAESNDRLRKSTYKGGPKRNRDKPFVFWDGEGYTDSDGVHHYMLFGNSRGSYVSGKSLTHRQCFDLMLSENTNKDAIHVIFAGGYDTVMMIQSLLSDSKKERIIKGQPTHVDGYRIEYRKGKYMKLSDGTNSIILYDVFTFFASSFVKACREYLGDDETLQRMERTKAIRNTFSLDMLETEVIPYWQEELAYGVELMNRLRSSLEGAGIICSQWHGPGAVAGAVLRQRGIGAFKNERTAIREPARHAYYGGRFEQFQIGLHNQLAYQYDIRSAYPAAITLLCSLSSGQWIHRSGGQPKRLSPYGLYRCSIQPQLTSPYHSWALPGAVPWRDKDKSIYYPQRLHSSWYWGNEVIVMQRVGAWPYTIDEWYEPKGLTATQPFEWVQAMYDERARMKREGNPSQLAVKLAINSLYGKLAQSKGARYDEDSGKWHLPRWHQMEWAGWITSYTRARILEAAMQCSRGELIAIETDALYTTRELDLDIGLGLGQWEREELEAIMYVQSGVYFKRKEGRWLMKSRGFNPAGQEFEIWRKALAMEPWNHQAISIRTRQFGTQVGRPDFAKWTEVTRDISLGAVFGKRFHLPEMCEACSKRGSSYADELHELVVPTAFIDSQTVPSRPHPLPWVDDPGYPRIEWENEWVIDEDDYEIFTVEVQE